MSLIHVKITPEAKSDTVEKKTDTSYMVSVREPAELNQANKKMLRLLAAYFEVSLSKVKIVTGHKQPSKIIEISEETLSM
ncbi:MAG: hypothetical protein RIQ72_45 [Candidatus Parcubacteria bacterium]|jgi:uncharacterized protein YggU (UPF0235/DUF167 family)